MTQLTPHFSLEEFTRSQTAARLGIENKPGDNELANLLRLAYVMEQVRAVLVGFVIVSSGYRCAELNHAIGGVSDSAHVDGRGCDFTVHGWENIQAARMIRDSDVMKNVDQLILEYGWIHLGIPKDGEEPRRMCLTKRSAQAHYEPGLNS